MRPFGRRKRKRVSHGKQIRFPRTRNTRVFNLNLSELNALEQPAGFVFICGKCDSGELGFGLQSDGKHFPQRLPSLVDIVDITCGDNHTVCLDNNGKVYTFGSNASGQLGRTVLDNGNAIPTEVFIPEQILRITAGAGHTSALSAYQFLYLWGSFQNSEGRGIVSRVQMCPALLHENVYQMASGSEHIVLLATNGDVLTCGCPEQGQLGRVGQPFAHNFRRDGRENASYPQKIELSVRGTQYKFQNVMAGYNSSFIQQNETFRLFSFGENNYMQLGLPEMRNYFFPTISRNIDIIWKDIRCSRTHTLYLDNRGSVYVRGINSHGCLGIQDPDDPQTELRKVSRLNNVFINSIACNESISYAVTADGDVYAWGIGENHQFGLGDDVQDRYFPTLITTDTTLLKSKSVLKVAAGRRHTVFLVKPEMYQSVE